MDFLKVLDILDEDNGPAACEHSMHVTFLVETVHCYKSEVLAILVII